MYLHGREVDVKIDEVKPFISEKFNGIAIKWYGDIGWGEYMLYRKEGDNKWYGNSEYMDSKNDKVFLKLLLNEFVDKVEIER